MKDLLIESIFLGFGIFMPIASLLSIRKNEAARNIIWRLMDSAITVVRLAGIAFLSLWLFNFYSYYEQPDSGYEEYSMINRMFGPYWFGYWLYLLVYGGLTQLFWVKAIKRSKVAGVIIAVVILIVSSYEKFVIIVTSLHRDYLPVGWSFFDARFFFGWTIKIGIFAITVALVYVIRNREIILRKKRTARRD